MTEIIKDTPQTEIFLSTDIKLPNQSGESFADQVIPQHNFIRGLYYLPDPAAIFKVEETLDLQSQRLEYFEHLTMILRWNGISVKKLDSATINAGAYHQDHTDLLLMNYGMVGTHIGRNKRYDIGAFLVDFTIESTRSLLDKTFPKMTNEQLSQKSVASLFSPTMLESRFPQLNSDAFFSLSKKHLKYHQHPLK